MRIGGLVVKLRDLSLTCGAC